MMRIIVTGASRGIGYDTAKRLALDGHQVLGLARNAEDLARLEKQVFDQFPKARLRTRVMDITDLDAELLQTAIGQMGGLDVLLNNAGYLVRKPFPDLDRADWEKSLAVNLFGPAEMIRICLPFLEKSKSAHIVNIGSMGGYPGARKFPELAAYAAAKAALANLTETLAVALGKQGIAVNCLALGAVQTDMLDKAFPGFRTLTGPEDMAGFLAYFCTEGQRFFHGKVLPVSHSNP